MKQRRNVSRSIVLVASLWLATPLRSQQPTATQDIGEKFQDLQTVVERQNADLAEQRRRLGAIESFLQSSPGAEVQNEDYIVARSHFHTRLLRKGPPPDKGAPVVPPQGVTEIVYPSGALRLKAWVSQPVHSERRSPAVLFLHGGFEFTKDDWEQSKPYRDAGFIVLTPMLRAENGQVGAFSYFYDEVDDVLAAAEYLAKLPYVDPTRVFLAGHSVGGTLTLLAAQSSRRFRAATSFSGASFWPEFAESQVLPFDRSRPEEIRMRSPINYASSFHCPVRMFFGTAEDSFFGIMSRRTAELAKKAGLDVEATPVEGDHGSHVAKAMLQSIAFFKKLAPDEAPAAGMPADLPRTLDVDLGQSIRLKLVRVEPGQFMMGSPANEAGHRDGEAQHQAVVAKPYLIGVVPVTQSQYRQLLGRRPSQFSSTGNSRDKVTDLDTDEFPIENVRWEDAMDFARVLSLLPELRDHGWVADLPSEVEWEYATRAGTQTPFHFGAQLSSQQANFNGNNPYGGAPKGPFVQRTTKVGSYSPNAWGLYDMHGNVLQWTRDWYDKDYRADASDMTARTARGCFWGQGSNGCRAARRMPVQPNVRGSGLGFRIIIRPRDK